VGWILAAVVALVCAPPASAGTYDVVSCGAPGAGGTNAAWRTEVVGGPYFTASASCPLLAESKNEDGPVAGFFFDRASLIVEAPGPNMIQSVQLWRKLFTWCCEHWTVVGQDAQARNVTAGLAPEICESPPAYPNYCGSGGDTGMSTENERRVMLNSGSLAYNVLCNNPGSTCKTGGGGIPFAQVRIFGSRITVRDEMPPQLTLRAGGLLTDGWVRPTEAFTVDATDAAGISELRAEASGQVGRVNPACDFRRMAPCVNASGTLLRIDGLPDGVQRATIVAVDPAGNETAQVRELHVDGTPPGTRLSTTSGHTVAVAVADALSGVAGGTIAVRAHDTDPWSELSTVLQGRRLVATLAGGRASRMDVRVTVRDNAGNETSGVPPRLTLTAVRAGKRTRRVRSGRVTAPFGRTVLLRGRLTTPTRKPLAGMAVSASGAIQRPGAAVEPLARATTSRTGRFSLRIGSGPSRRLNVMSAGTGEVLTTARALTLRVPASSTLHASRRRLAGGGTVRFSGRLRTLHQPIPPRGIVVILQGRERGTWQTFADTRTDARGRWRVRYRFRGRPGTYPIRARVRAADGFPFVRGSSHTLRVHVL
jgi:hypothetical protein